MNLGEIMVVVITINKAPEVIISAAEYKDKGMQKGFAKSRGIKEYEIIGLEYKPMLITEFNAL